MKLRFIVILIIFTVLLTGCSTESKQAIVNKEPSYTLDEKETVRNTSEDTADDSLQKNPSSAETSSANKSTSLSENLFTYLSIKENRNSVAKRANELHGGTMHNSCVYVASEALRRVGIEIPDSMSWIPTFIEELKRQGFKTSYNLEDLKPGDICFTTDVNGVAGGRPTHTYIFMSWESPGVARIVDNQSYDYGDVYHTRSIEFHYLNNMKDKPKEAIAFFMYK